MAPTAADTQDTMAAKEKMGWDMGRDMSQLTCSDLVMGHEDANELATRFVMMVMSVHHHAGSACTRRTSKSNAEANTVGRSDALAFLDSLDSLPDMIRLKLKRDFCDGLG